MKCNQATTNQTSPSQNTLQNERTKLDFIFLTKINYLISPNKLCEDKRGHIFNKFELFIYLTHLKKIKKDSKQQTIN